MQNLEYRSRLDLRHSTFHVRSLWSFPPELSEIRTPSTLSPKENLHARTTHRGMGLAITAVDTYRPNGVRSISKSNRSFHRRIVRWMRTCLSKQKCQGSACQNVYRKTARTQNPKQRRIQKTSITLALPCPHQTRKSSFCVCRRRA